MEQGKDYIQKPHYPILLTLSQPSIVTPTQGGALSSSEEIVWAEA